MPCGLVASAARERAKILLLSVWSGNVSRSERIVKIFDLCPQCRSPALFKTCTECSYKIQPAELLYVDSKRCRCPQRGAEPLAKRKEKGSFSS